MKKYIKTNLILVVMIFTALKLMDFNQTMSAYWIGPYLSAATNFHWSEFTLYVNMDEIKEFAKLSTSELFQYHFIKTDDLMLYNYLGKGLVLLIILSKKIFFWQGDLQSLQSLQYVFHIFISITVFNLFQKRYQKILFFILYTINPLILWVANFPFYYFWQVIPSTIFIYWYFKKDIKLPLLMVFSVIFAYIYITRPTVLFLIILFYILFAFRNSIKSSLVGLGLFLLLINLAPSLSIGPWHTMYVGVGAYSNPYNIKLSDNDGYKYYKEKTGKIVSSSNIMHDDIKDDYYKELKIRLLEITKENPLMIVRNAMFNIAQSYSFGYSKSINKKVGNYSIVYLSIFSGVVVMLLLLYTQQYLIFLAIGFAGGTFTLYYPPILVYMYGNFILLVIGFIGIVDFFINKRHTNNAR